MKKTANDYETVLKDGVFTLSKPYKYGDGPEREVLDFPLKELTGQHVRTAQRSYEMIEGRGVPSDQMAEFNKTYLGYLAAVLMKVQPDFVFDLPVKDFTVLTLFLQNFLLSSD
jgi:hypothetical protein